MIFRRTDKYGYSRYYGGGGPALVIKIIVAILAVILLILGIVIFAMQKYMVYTANGGHLEFPWDKKPSASDDVNGGLIPGDPLDSNGDGSQSDPSGMVTGNLETDPADTEPQGDASTGDTSEPETDIPEKKPPLSDGVLIQHVSIGDVTSGHAEGDLNNVKANGIMLYMKESGGKLNYVSELELANTFKVSTSTSTSNSVQETISQLNDDDYYTLAYVNCFQDQTAGTKKGYSLYDEGGASWYDGEKRAWADPANEEMQDYIVGIVKEMVEMGYDEIVLTNAAYPLTGDTSILSGDCYDPDTFQDTVNSFYAKLADAVKDSDTILSVIVSPAVIENGVGTLSGQTLENLLQLGGRLWVDASEVDDPDALAEKLSQAGYPDNALGLLVDSFDSDSSYCQMNLN